MAIFGKVDQRLFLDSEEEYIHIYREGNDWDVFLNYLFGLLFIFYFIIGVSVNPFIIWYHSRQKKSFTTILFLSVSIIDQIKSICLPLVLIPKLFSPLKDNDYYYDQDLSSVPWSSYSNEFILVLAVIEADLLIVLCITRYMTLKDPLASDRKRNKIFSALLFVHFLCVVCHSVSKYFFKPLCHMRLFDFVVSMNREYADISVKIVLHILNAFSCLLLLVAIFFCGLTIVHLKNSNTAASNTSARNIRKGIAAILAMNFFNVFAIFSAVVFSIYIHILAKSNWESYSTTSDIIQFTNAYVVTLTQSAFNSISFLCICSSFRMCVKNIFRRPHPNPNQPRQVTMSVIAAQTPL